MTPPAGYPIRQLSDAVIEARFSRVDEKLEEVDGKVDKLDGKLDDVLAAHADLAGYVRGQMDERKVRRGRESDGRELIGPLAADVVAERAYKRDLKLKVIGGVIALVTSSVFLTWLVAAR